TIESAVAITRRGGRIVLVGAGSDDVRLNVPAFSGLITAEKTVTGSFYGSSHVARDVAKLLSLYETGELNLDDLVSSRFSFEDMNDGLDYCESEQGARAVIVF